MDKIAGFLGIAALGTGAGVLGVIGLIILMLLSPLAAILIGFVVGTGLKLIAGAYVAAGLSVLFHATITAGMLPQFFAILTLISSYIKPILRPTFSNNSVINTPTKRK